VDDRERAEKVLTRSRRSPALGSLEDVVAAEFAAVREPLERRVAQLEAALRECIEYCEGIQTPPPWMEQCRAALAVTAVANPGSAGIAEPTQEPEG